MFSLSHEVARSQAQNQPTQELIDWVTQFVRNSCFATQEKDDATQDMLLILCRSLQKLEPENTSLEGWFRTTLQRLWLFNLRTKRNNNARKISLAYKMLTEVPHNLRERVTTSLHTQMGDSIMNNFHQRKR